MISDDSVSAGVNRDGQISPLNKGQYAMQNTMNLNILFCQEELAVTLTNQIMKYLEMCNGEKDCESWFIKVLDMQSSKFYLIQKWRHLKDTKPSSK